MSNFIPGLTLSELFYQEAARPILEAYFPRVQHSAALIGRSSEVLGYDDPISTDHNWGPRFYLFLAKEDHEKYSTQINQALSEKLPHEFRGYPVDFSIGGEGTGPADAEIGAGSVDHKIEIETIESFFGWYLGCNPYERITAADWLTFSEHKLLGVTSGKVFHDGLGELERVRQQFSYYPKDVWLYLIATQWLKIFEEQAFVGRSGDVGDELGSMLIAARQVKNLIYLCFLMEQRYAPYSKWFGTAFSRLECARELTPVFQGVILSSSWKEREAFLSRAYEAIARMHNALKITKPIAEKVYNYCGRPYLVLDEDQLVREIIESYTDEEIKRIKHGLGSINQLIDSTNKASNIFLRKKLKELYE